MDADRGLNALDFLFVQETERLDLHRNPDLIVELLDPHPSAGELLRLTDRFQVTYLAPLDKYPEDVAAGVNLLIAAWE